MSHGCLGMTPRPEPEPLSSQWYSFLQVTLLFFEGSVHVNDWIHKLLCDQVADWLQICFSWEQNVNNLLGKKKNLQGPAVGLRKVPPDGRQR